VSGGVDVTADLQHFLDRVPDGATISFPAGARFRIDGTLWLTQRRDLRLEGNGSTFFAGTVSDDSGRSMWRIRDSVGVTVSGFVIRGAHPRPGTYIPGFEWQHGLHVLGGGDIVIADTTIEAVHGDCVYVGGSSNGLADGIRFHDSMCRDNGRMGVAIVGGRNVLIERVTFSNMAYAAIDLEPDTTGVDQGAFDIEVRDTLMTGKAADRRGNVWFSMGGGGPVARVHVHDNRVEAPWGLYIGTCGGCDQPRFQDVVIARNTASTGTTYEQGAPMYFQRVDRLAVTDNHAPSDGQRCTTIVDSTSVTVSGNTGCSPQT
jgi:hypothetical protein